VKIAAIEIANREEFALSAMSRVVKKVKIIWLNENILFSFWLSARLALNSTSRAAICFSNSTSVLKLCSIINPVPESNKF
jgi:hypothetical protein